MSWALGFVLLVVVVLVASIPILIIARLVERYNDGYYQQVKSAQQYQARKRQEP